MSSGEPLPRIAVLGQGSIGRRHTRLLSELGCQVTVFDPVSPPAPEAAHVANSEETALADADAVVVASPSAQHLEQALRVVEAGLPQLVEKPLATSAAGAERLRDAAAQQGVLLAVAMNLRFHPGPLLVKRLVDEGAIGMPLTAHFTFGYHLPAWRAGVDYRQTYSARADMGGGILLDAIHELDLAHWVLGPARDVDARLARVSQLEIDVEDVALLHVSYESGALASIELDYLDRSYRRGCRVVGTDASVTWDCVGERVVVSGRDGEVVHPAPRNFDVSYAGEIKAFVEAVAAGRTTTEGTELVGAHDASAVLRLVEAAVSSSGSGERTGLRSDAGLR